MKRVLLSLLLSSALIGGTSLLAVAANPSNEKPASSSAASVVPATRYYPMSVGNRWSYGFKRKTAFTMIPASGENQDFSFDSTGTHTVEIVREDGERSGEQGKVYVQRATEVLETSSGSEEAEPPSTDPRLVGELYFRVNDRGIWLISDGEPDEKGEQIVKVEDRRLPLLWVPTDLKPGKSWTIRCQLDTTVTARIVSRAGQPKTLRVNGVSYENCIPVVSLADNIEGRLDLGFALAPISGGRIVDITWYAPGIGVVRSHQLANFELDPPSANYTSATAHFEETQELQPGYKAR